MTDTDFPLPTTPLSGLRALVLDTETTGLDVTTARIVSIGALAIDGSEIEDDGALSVLVNPGVPIPPESTRIHGISDTDVAEAGGFSEHAGSLTERLHGRALVGHNIGFDVAILAREYAGAALDWSPPPSLDTGLLARALRPDLPDTSLETLASWLGVQVSDRHSALGDARTTAEIFVRLIPELARANVRTLAEAQRFAMVRNETTARRHAEAGWQVGAHGTAPARTVPDLFPYRHALSELMSTPPRFTTADATLAEAVSLMAGAEIGAVLVGSADDLQGIVSERDIVRQLSREPRDGLQSPVRAVMRSPVDTLPADSPAYRAIARLQRLSLRHIAVTGPDDEVVGVVSARDLLRQSAGAALVLDDEIDAAANPAELARAFARTPAAASRLRTEGLDAKRISGLVSEEVRALTCRAADIALEGYDAPPGRWSLLVLGSAGRGESLLAPDQDNALVFDDAPGMTDWAPAFGDRVNQILDTAGLPLCKGGVMAGQAAWCHTLEGWHRHVGHWAQHADNEDLLNADIFFDLQHVAGDPVLSRRLRANALDIAHRSPGFIRALNESVSQLQTPVGLFGRLRTVEGRLDIKAAGLLPVVTFARAVALHHEIDATSTPERLATAAAAGALPEADAERLAGMHGAFVALALDQQLHDIAAGRPPSYNVKIARLDKDARRDLADDLSDLGDILSLAWSTLSN